MTDQPTDHPSLRQYLKRLEDNVEQVQRRLKRFEAEFGMDSEEFYSKLHNAELDERIEYAEWAGEHEMLQRLIQQRDELKKRLTL
jgi:guanylate kinase